MFETGFSDLVTIKRATAGTEDSNHNQTATWAAILTSVPCETYNSDKGEIDIGDGIIVKVLEKIFIKTTTVIKTGDVAIVNTIRYDIRQVLKRKGFGGYHFELMVERRSHGD